MTRKTQTNRQSSEPEQQLAERAREQYARARGAYKAAWTTGETLEALSVLAWHGSKRPSDIERPCPANRIADEAAICAVASGDIDTRGEHLDRSHEALNSLLGELDQPSPLKWWVVSEPNHSFRMLATSTVRQSLFDSTYELDEVHDAWLDARRKARDSNSAVPDHPLRPLIEGWQARSDDVRSVSRATRIIPGARQLPAIRREMPEPREGGVPGLPALADDEGLIRQAVPLRLYDARMQNAYLPAGGRGYPPVAQRLATILLAGVPPNERTGRVDVSIPYGVMLNELWPGQRPRSKERWKPIQHAIGVLCDSYIALPGGDQGWWPFARGPISSIVPSLDGLLTFDLRMVPATKVGPRIHMPTLHKHSGSARAYRLILNLCQLWHDRLQYTRRGRDGSIRYLMHPVKQPAVKREPSTGVILDAAGKPVIDQQGKPVRNPSDERARPVLDDKGQPSTERNPKMDLLPELGPDDLVELTHPKIGMTAERFRSVARRRALETLRDVAAVGDCQVEGSIKTGIRILPPDDWIEKLKG